MENYVRLLGSKREEDVGSFLHSADAFLFTGIVDAAGDRDGIPNVILEAMDAGCLVISSINAGASEAFIDGVSGFSLDPEKPRQWVDLLSEFHQNPESFLRIRKKAMWQVRENFDIKKTASLLSGAIQKTIENEAK